MTAEDYRLARRLWHQLEPVHAVFWYAPEVFAEAAALGYEVKTRWPSYFAWRLAPLGAVGPRLAASACYSFSPHMVGAHVPAAWAVASPPQILAARERAADRMYRALLGDLIDSPGLAEAADLAREAALAAGTAGRPLAAANADLPWPGEPHLVLCTPSTCSASSAATAISPRCRWPGSTRAKRWCRSPPSAPHQRRSSPAADGARPNGRRPGTG